MQIHLNLRKLTSQIWTKYKRENHERPKLISTALHVGMMFSTLFAPLMHICSALEKRYQFHPTFRYEKKNETINYKPT